VVDPTDLGPQAKNHLKLGADEELKRFSDCQRQRITDPTLGSHRGVVDTMTLRCNTCWIGPYIFPSQKIPNHTVLFPPSHTEGQTYSRGQHKELFDLLNRPPSGPISRSHGTAVVVG